MEVYRYSGARAFLKRVQVFLEEEEVVNNLPLGILFLPTRKQGRSEQEAEPLFALAEHGGAVSFVMLMTPPHNLIVYGAGEHLDRAMEASVSFLLTEEVPVPGVIGPRDVAEGFADLWTRKTGCTAEVRMEQMIYRLDRVNEIALCPGRLVYATLQHVDLLSEWIAQFSQITPEPVSREEAQQKAEKAVEESRVFLWHDDVPVSMAVRARPTRNGVVVSGVYTPPEFRNRGYSTSCVSSLSKTLLDEGYAFCSLYTDLSNPTSNHIYKRIGYRPVRRSVVYGFERQR